MRAPRASANSRSSSTSIAATFAEHEAVALRHRTAGWLVSGSSLWRESAFIESKPPIAVGMTVASLPPVTTAIA